MASGQLLFVGLKNYSVSSSRGSSGRRLSIHGSDNSTTLTAGEMAKSMSWFSLPLEIILPKLFPRLAMVFSFTPYTHYVPLQ